jgi:hypothetical protein
LNLNLESGFDGGHYERELREERVAKDKPKRQDDWTGQRKVRIQTWDDDEGELGDSCCFGTRTVNVGADCIWKLHGGV